MEKTPEFEIDLPARRVRFPANGAELSFYEYPADKPHPEYGRFGPASARAGSDRDVPTTEQEHRAALAFNNFQRERRTEVLKRYGLVDRPVLEVEARQDPHGLWRVKVAGEGDPLTLIDLGGAKKLAEELRRIGEQELVDRIEATAEAARKRATRG